MFWALIEPELATKKASAFSVHVAAASSSSYIDASSNVMTKCVVSLQLSYHQRSAYLTSTKEQTAI